MTIAADPSDRGLTTWRAVLPLLMLAASCGDRVECDGSFRLDGLTDWQRERADRVAVNYAQFVGRSVVHFSPDGKCRISTAGVPKGTRPGLPGGYDVDTGDIGISAAEIEREERDASYPVPTDLHWEDIIAHEIGHSFGMRHLAPGAVGVMSEYVTFSGFSAADRAECKRAGLCAP